MRARFEQALAKTQARQAAGGDGRAQRTGSKKAAKAPPKKQPAKNAPPKKKPAKTKPATPETGSVKVRKNLDSRTRTQLAHSSSRGRRTQAKRDGR